MVDEQCTNVFKEIKMHGRHRYSVFHIKNENRISVETVGGRNESYDSFLTDMKIGEGECRYGLYDMEYEHHSPGITDVGKKQKMFLMASCPDTASTVDKTLYAFSFSALKKSLVGVPKYVQATNEEEASLERVMEKLRSTDEE